ncbi:MAG: Dabb family protein [Pseudomonadota bacterium]
MRHLLLIQFKPEVGPADIDALFAHFKRIPDEIPGIVGIECGANESPEGLDKGYTHVVLMTFEDAAARDAYLPHPAHDALKAVFVPMIGDIIVIDYPI